MTRPTTLIGIAFAIVVALALSIPLLFTTREETGTAAGWSALALRDIPPSTRAAYERAALRYNLDGPFILAGVGKVETNHGRSKLPGVSSGVNSYGCCAGPMQFMVSRQAGCRTSCYSDPSKGTWEAYAVDGDGDGRLNVYDIDDAIMTGAHYLSANGAPGDWRAALFVYNRSEAYGREVREWGDKYRAEGASIATGPVSARGFVWPARGPVVSPFGPRWGRMHEGVDIAIPNGTPLVSSADGKVSYSGVMSGYGNVIDVQHDGGLTTRYAHQERLIAPVGKKVRRGEVIGMSGCTGRCFGPHVHYEVHVNGAPADPMQFLS